MNNKSDIFQFMGFKTVKDISSCGDAYGVYGWYLPAVSLKQGDIYSKFYTLFREKLSQENEICGKRYSIDVKKKLISGMEIALKPNHSQMISDDLSGLSLLFSPPLYVGKAYRKEESIYRRIIEEKKSDLVGGKITQILKETGMHPYCSINDFYIKYFDIGRYIEDRKISMERDEIDEFAKSIEKLLFVNYFPPLNTKQGN